MSTLSTVCHDHLSGGEPPGGEMQHLWHYPSGEATLRCASCGVSGADWFGESCVPERQATGRPSDGDRRPADEGGDRGSAPEVERQVPATERRLEPER